MHWFSKNLQFCVDNYVIFKHWWLYFFLSKSMCLLYVCVYTLLLITLPSSPMLKKGDENNLIFFPILEGKQFPQPASSTLPIGFFVGTLYQIRKVPLAESFFMNISWLLSNDFSSSSEMICSLFFSLMMWQIALTDFKTLNQLYIPEATPTWSWFIIYFTHC